MIALLSQKYSQLKISDLLDEEKEESLHAMDKVAVTKETLPSMQAEGSSRKDILLEQLVPDKRLKFSNNYVTKSNQHGKYVMQKLD
jgi:hypothetical protein